MYDDPPNDANDIDVNTPPSTMPYEHYSCFLCPHSAALFTSIGRFSKLLSAFCTHHASHASSGEDVNNSGETASSTVG